MRELAATAWRMGLSHRIARACLVALLVVLSLVHGHQVAVAQGGIEQRIADFWKRVDALQPADLLSSTDLGQWALNVIERDATARITVTDFRVATPWMQTAMDDNRGTPPSPGSNPPSGPPGTTFTTCFTGFTPGAVATLTTVRPDKSSSTTTYPAPIALGGKLCLPWGLGFSAQLGVWQHTLTAGGRTETISYTVKSATNVEQRIADFWKRLEAKQPGDLLSSTDLGQWALNVIERDAAARIAVEDFRTATALMQKGMDRARSGVTTPPLTAPDPNGGCTASLSPYAAPSEAVRSMTYSCPTDAAYSFTFFTPSGAVDSSLSAPSGRMRTFHLSPNLATGIWTLVIRQDGRRFRIPFEVVN